MKPSSESELLKAFNEVYTLVSRLPEPEQIRLLEGVASLLGFWLEIKRYDEDADEDEYRDQED